MLDRRHVVLSLAAALGGCAVPPKPTQSPVARDEWHPFVLPGKRETLYSAATKDGRACWHAHAQGSASMLRRPIGSRSIEGLTAEFSWWVPAVIAGADFGRAEASDSPARVAFAFAGDLARLPARTRMQFQLAEMLTGEAPPFATLMYVWATDAPEETVYHSARTDRVRKIVVETGTTHLRRWRHYRRDLAADYRRAFGEAPGPLVAIGLMTDADNTGTSAEAWYGDVLLS